MDGPVSLTHTNKRDQLPRHCPTQGGSEGHGEGQPVWRQDCSRSLVFHVVWTERGLEEWTHAIHSKTNRWQAGGERVWGGQSPGQRMRYVDMGHLRGHRETMCDVCVEAPDNKVGQVDLAVRQPLPGAYLAMWAKWT